MGVIVRKNPISLPVKKTRNRETVLIPMSIKDLREKFGDDTLILVGRKHMTKLLTKKTVAELSG